MTTMGKLDQKSKSSNVTPQKTINNGSIMATPKSPEWDLKYFSHKKEKPTDISGTVIDLI